MVLTVDDIAKRLTPIFQNNGVTRAVLFGSYAKGEATEDSDIDMVVELDPEVRALKYFGILEDLVEVLGKKVDMIPYRSIIPNERVDLEISRTGKVIYER
jgi:predicted nucleotidyltransferase